MAKKALRKAQHNLKDVEKDAAATRAAFLEKKARAHELKGEKAPTNIFRNLRKVEELQRMFR